MLSAAPGAAAVVTQADLRKAEAWPNGLLTFDAETLGAAAAELNRYSRQQLVIRDPRVAQLRISGVFKAGDAERFAGTLSQVQPVRVVRRGPDTLELAPAS
jgi:transmembrane sensor